METINQRYYQEKSEEARDYIRIARTIQNENISERLRDNLELLIGTMRTFNRAFNTLAREWENSSVGIADEGSAIYNRGNKMLEDFVARNEIDIDTELIASFIEHPELLAYGLVYAAGGIAEGEDIIGAEGMWDDLHEEEE